MEAIKDSLKQYIESRLQKANRLQALYADHFYVSAPFVRKLDPGQMNYLSCRSFSDEDTAEYKKDFKW